MIAGIDDVVEISRVGKAVIARLLQPAWVVSTCGINGGLRDDVTAIYNQQSCEPAVHHERVGTYLSTHQRQLHDQLCLANGLDGQRTAGMGTAASMRCLGVAKRHYREVQVLALATAGVEGNAGRAGDPAAVFEWDGQYEKVGPEQPAVGTINTMVFFSHELKPGTLLRSVMTATEAKSTVLDELVVGSRYSPGKATGTGTDQYSAACPIGRGPRPLAGVGKHSKLGELLAQAVRAAIAEALELQNGLTPASRRSIGEQLRRFGYRTESLLDRARQLLDPADAALLAANWLSADRDPMTVAACAGYATVLDQLRSGVLPPACAGEIRVQYARMIASAISGATDWDDQLQVVTDDPVDTVYQAVAFGFAQKWHRLHTAAQASADSAD